MAEKKRFLLRLDVDVWARLEAWAADELRSVNGQIEYVLREALRARGRLRPPAEEAGEGPSRPLKDGPLEQESS